MENKKEMCCHKEHWCQEEWDKKVSSLLETDDSLTMTTVINGKKLNVISAGLKVKKDGLT